MKANDNAETVQAQIARTFARLRRDLDADLERVSALRAVNALRPELDELLEDLDRQRERMRDAAVICLVGATGAGKSTLLNALVGAPVATEGEDRPTTKAPVVFAPGDAELGALLARLPGAAPQVVRYDPRRAAGPWTEQVLIDAPDVNSVAVEHRAVVHALAQRSDVLLVVLHHQSLVEEASVSFVDAFAGRRRLMFVMNRADELNDASREALLADLRGLRDERWRSPEAPIFAVSARAAQARPDTPGWGELCGALRELVTEGVLGGVRRHNAIGTAARIGDLAARAQGEVEAELAELPGAVRTGLDALTARLAAEARERLALSHADLAQRLWSEAGKRWDGPGGWWLRTGGLGSLGLGAGAALARRNPLLAAGAALGGLAAEEARGALRERRLGDSTGFLPAATRFQSLYVEALGPARRSSARLAGSTAAFAVPTAGEARAAAETLVAEAWDELLARELPAAAERSVPFLLRWSVDLPVYALAGWIVWKAAEGFLSEDYVGAGLLVNAAIVASAFLFLVRFGVRRILAVRARGLLEATVRRAQAGLDAWAEDVHGAVAAASELPRESLGRLVASRERWRSELGAAQ